MFPEIHYDTFSMERYFQAIELWKECAIKIESEDTPEKLGAYLLSEYAKGFMATSQTDLIGMALCSSDGRYGYIHHLAVSPKFRHGGIGSELVEKCKQHILATLKVDKIVIFIRDANVNGQAFWRNIGFEKAEGLHVAYITLHSGGSQAGG